MERPSNGERQELESLRTRVGHLAHDFNNVLTGILGLTELLRTEMPPQAPGSQKLQQIQDLVERATGLAYELAACARAPATEVQPPDLNQLLSTLPQHLQPRLPNNIQMVIHPAPDLGSVQGRVDELAPMIAKLCLQAQATIPNGGTLYLETRNVLWDESAGPTGARVRPGLYALLQIAAVGTGMDRAAWDARFEPLAARKEPQPDTDLATIEPIVQQQGGFVHAASEPGYGATFRIYLPATRAAARGGGR